jgi:transcriptional regulator with XRE-family HTH domain
MLFFASNLLKLRYNFAVCRLTPMEVDVERLRELRRRRVLTMEELAEKAGVGLNTIWRLEHGVMGAQPRTIRKLARALSVEPEELVKAGGSNA